MNDTKQTEENKQADECDSVKTLVMQFNLRGRVIYKGEEHEIYDIDEAYNLLALSGDRYICPNHEDNRCIEAPMSECTPITKHLNDAVEMALVIIANAGKPLGDWDSLPKEWQEAAATWRAKYLA
jgi:hypothetical protein